MKIVLLSLIVGWCVVVLIWCGFMLRFLYAWKRDIKRQSQEARP